MTIYRPFNQKEFVTSRIFEKLLNNRLSHHLDNEAFFLIFSRVSTEYHC